MGTNKLQSVGLLVLRVVVGLVMAYFGSQKLLGVFGGYGFQATLDAFEKNMGIPRLFGTLAIFAEFFGGLGIAAGVLTRVAAFGVACTMAVATFTHITEAGVLNQMFVTGGGTAAKDVFFPMVLFSGAVALLFIGGGSYTLDSLYLGKGKKAKK